MLHKRIIIISALLLLVESLGMVCYGQTVLSLDSCRAMALRNNKQMRVAEVRRDVAANVRRAARTKYLPHVSAVGGYEHTSREISLLSDAQKSALGNLGTGLAGELQGGIAGYAQVLPTALQQQIGADLSQMAGALNDRGLGGRSAHRYTQHLGGLHSADATALYGWGYRGCQQDG